MPHLYSVTSSAEQNNHGYERRRGSGQTIRFCEELTRSYEGPLGVASEVGIKLMQLQKYTVHSHGIWDRIRRAFAVDPTRSTGVPINAQFRKPPPGANPPEAYDDPVTVPSGDIAENPYYKRDIRRSYPRLSVIKQADVVGLLSVGSRSRPKDDVLQLGDAGPKQLVQMKKDGEERGLSAYIAKHKASNILDAKGLPPFPSGLSSESAAGTRRYTMDRESGYPEECATIQPWSITLAHNLSRYPCRTFV